MISSVLCCLSFKDWIEFLLHIFHHRVKHSTSVQLTTYITCKNLYNETSNPGNSRNGWLRKSRNFACPVIKCHTLLYVIFRNLRRITGLLLPTECHHGVLSTQYISTYMNKIISSLFMTITINFHCSELVYLFLFFYLRCNSSIMMIFVW